MQAETQTSDRQLRANRRNAKKGGVKTLEGKLVTRMNACKHGGLSNSVLDGEWPAYKALLDELTEEYEPSGIVQKVLVERIAICILQMRRVSFAANEYMQQIENPEISRPMFDLLDDKVIENPGYQPAITTEQIEKILDLYQRYQVSLENRFLKLARELSNAKSGEA